MFIHGCNFHLLKYEQLACKHCTEKKGKTNLSYNSGS